MSGGCWAMPLWQSCRFFPAKQEARVRDRGHLSDVIFERHWSINYEERRDKPTSVECREVCVVERLTDCLETMYRDRPSVAGRRGADRFRRCGGFPQMHGKRRVDRQNSP